MDVAYSVGMVAEAISASPAVSFPAVMLWARMVWKMASLPFTFWAVSAPILAVVSTIPSPPSVSPASISPWEGCTSWVWMVPSAPIITW